MSNFLQKYEFMTKRLEQHPYKAQKSAWSYTKALFE
jgi:hypothetical protein